VKKNAMHIKLRFFTPSTPEILEIRLCPKGLPYADLTCVLGGAELANAGSVTPR
jgi:hypothetical protein